MGGVRVRWLAIVACGAFFVGALGCGGDDSGDGDIVVGTGPAMSRGAWVAAADSICSDGYLALGWTVGPLFGQPVEDAQPLIEEAFSTLRDTTMVELRALTPPDEDRMLVDRMLDVFDEFNDAYEEYTKAWVAAGPDAETQPEFVAMHVEMMALGEELEEQASALGLEQCMSGAE